MGKTRQAAAPASSSRSEKTANEFMAEIRFKMFPKEGQPEKDNGFTIAKARKSGEHGDIVLKGNFGPVSPGEVIQVKKSRPRTDPRFGKYIQVLAVSHQDPIDRDQVAKYLNSRANLPTEIGEMIFDQLGETCLEQIDADPDKALNSISLPEADRNLLIAGWESFRMQERNLAFLTDQGFSEFEARTMARALKGVCAEDILDINPYALAEIEGIRFSKIDELALGQKGVAVDDRRRLMAGASHLLDQAESDGHICLTEEEMLDRVPDVLAVQGRSPARELCAEAINAMVAEERLISEQGEDGVERIYTPEQYAVETRLIKMILDRGAQDEQPLPRVFTPTPESTVTDEQFKAAKHAFTAPISILTGSAGCGKTTALKEVIDQADLHGLGVTCLAPTGKAAKRMTEATGRDASTIHRAIGMEGMKPPNLDEQRFDDPKHRIESDIVIVDEASMLDMRVAERLFSHLGPDTHLVLVGDPNQLPPVGAGAVLLDLIESERVPHTHLSKVFRQAEGSLLVINANRVKEGNEPYWTAAEAEQALGHPVKEDWVFIPEDDPIEALDQVVDIVKREAYEAGVEPGEVLVTAPSHKAEVGVRILNKRLQAEFNPDGKAIRGGIEPDDPSIKVGDVVMNTVNLYGRQGRPDVMNGDTGTVLSFDSKTNRARIDFGEREAVELSDAEMFGIVPSYAATTHKLQGSEAPVVVCPTLGTGGSRMLSRNLIYTAWTRGKSKCVVIGEKSRIRKAAQIDGTARNTTLNLKISGLAKKVEARWERLEALTKKKKSDYASSLAGRFKKMTDQR
jgi:exodeoxyribonuclease V alpha subunit